MTSIATFKDTLADLIEPDYGLLDQLMSLGVLTRRQYGDIRSEKGAFYRRNLAVLELMTTEAICQKLLTALDKTGQQHVVNLIKEKGGTENEEILEMRCERAHYVQ